MDPCLADDEKGQGERKKFKGPEGIEVKIIDVITTIANLRSTTEHRIANDYTYRQIQHIAVTYAKDKFMVVGEIMRIVSGSMQKTTSNLSTEKTNQNAMGEGSSIPKTRSDGLPGWYKPRYRPGVKTIGREVVQLDGPMKKLSPYLGKGSLKKYQQTRAKQLNKELKGR